MTIHCIGNSHVQIFSGADPMVYWPDTAQNLVPGFRTYNIGPIIAYNFTTKHLPKVRQVIEQEKIGKADSGDAIMLVVGEVDCRWHLPKQIQERGVDQFWDIINETGNRFFESFHILRNEGYRVIGWATHPTTPGPHNDDPDNPVYGDMLYRNAICKQWNKEMELRCQVYKIPFISIYDSLVNEQNETRTEYMRDYCHLSLKALPLALDAFRRDGIIT